jgi:hypothetical protein
MESRKVFLNDSYRDQTNDDLRLKIGNKLIGGYVEIYDKISATEKLLVAKPNLILYKGREWLAQRAVYQTMSAWDSQAKDGYINWFGVGVNGASPGDILTPLAPTLPDTNLLSPIVLDASESTYKDLTVSGNDYQVKPIALKTYINDIVNQNRYLIVQCQTTIVSTDANGPNGETYYDLNEAGLYVGGEDETSTIPVSIFARCTFSTIRKDSGRELVFLWNIYF